MGSYLKIAAFFIELCCRIMYFVQKKELKKQYLFIALLLAIFVSACSEDSGSDGQTHSNGLSGNGTSELPDSANEYNQAPSGTSKVLAKVVFNDKFGFIDTSGNFVLNPVYTSAKSFSEGYAFVNIGGKRAGGIGKVKGGSHQIIDCQGNVIHDSLQFYMDGFFNGYARVTTFDNKYVFIDKQAKIRCKKFDQMSHFRSGLIGVLDLEEERVGFVDENGAWKISFNNRQTVGTFSQGRSFFLKTHKYGYIDKSGRDIVPAKYKDAYDFSEGLASVARGKYYGYIDLQGNEVITPQFDQAGDFRDGLAPVLKNGLWGFIDKSGELAIQYKFQKVRGFFEDLSAVVLNNKVGYINKSGDVVIPAQFDDGSNFSYGLAAVKLGEKVGYIRKDGSWMIEPTFQMGGTFVHVDSTNSPLLY